MRIPGTKDLVNAPRFAEERGKDDSKSRESKPSIMQIPTAKVELIESRSPSSSNDSGMIVEG
jgi:hypothetical protein